MWHEGPITRPEHSSTARTGSPGENGAVARGTHPLKLNPDGGSYRLPDTFDPLQMTSPTSKISAGQQRESRLLSESSEPCGDVISGVLRADKASVVVDVTMNGRSGGEYEIAPSLSLHASPAARPFHNPRLLV
ncbi:hypothetical protein Bbelb_013490 [Branchiostoma belcheri]|nr:hypothetical protein Bbelb_013490 [Branchiostoma belcheri]